MDSGQYPCTMEGRWKRCVTIDGSVPGHRKESQARVRLLRIEPFCGVSYQEQYNRHVQ